MPDYSNGKIYTIRFHNSNEIYIGSTIQSLAVRFGGHKHHNKCSLYQLINSKYNSDWSVCYYELYENYSCNTNEELNKKEGEIIRQFKKDENYDCINKKIEARSDKQYKEDNIDKIKEYNKQYNKQYKKQYMIDNADKLKEEKKQYYQKNKEKISIKNKEKITCDCGSGINKGHISQHYKSKKHQDYLVSLTCVINACDKCYTQPISI